jgi:hypothetical protein
MDQYTRAIAKILVGLMRFLLNIAFAWYEHHHQHTSQAIARLVV